MTGLLTANRYQRVRQFCLDVCCCNEGRDLISVGETVDRALGTFTVIYFQVHHRSAKASVKIHTVNDTQLIGE